MLSVTEELTCCANNKVNVKNIRNMLTTCQNQNYMNLQKWNIAANSSSTATSIV